MADVVVFHHAQGLTDGVREFGRRLREAGHTVAVPDLYAGETFATIEDGVAHAQKIGFDTVINRGLDAVDELAAELVYVGFSLGVLPAQCLAQTRSGTRGAVLVHGCVPLGEFSQRWPDGVPVQIHGMDADPYFVSEGDLEAARALVAQVDGAELFLYPGATHLFADSGHDHFEPGAAELLFHRTLAFLG